MNKILVYLMVVVTSYLGMHASCGRNINYRAIQKRAIRGYTVFDFGRGAIEWKEIATRHNKGYLIEDAFKGESNDLIEQLRIA